MLVAILAMGRASDDESAWRRAAGDSLRPLVATATEAPPDRITDLPGAWRYRALAAALGRSLEWSDGGVALLLRPPRVRSEADRRRALAIWLSTENSRTVSRLASGRYRIAEMPDGAREAALALLPSGVPLGDALRSRVRAVPGYRLSVPLSGGGETTRDALAISFPPFPPDSPEPLPEAAFPPSAPGPLDFGPGRLDRASVLVRTAVERFGGRTPALVSDPVLFVRGSFTEATWAEAIARATGAARPEPLENLAPPRPSLVASPVGALRDRLAERTVERVMAAGTGEAWITLEELDSLGPTVASRLRPPARGLPVNPNFLLKVTVGLVFDVPGGPFTVVVD